MFTDNFACDTQSSKHFVCIVCFKSSQYLCELDSCISFLLCSSSKLCGLKQLPFVQLMILRRIAIQDRIHWVMILASLGSLLSLWSAAESFGGVEWGAASSGMVSAVLFSQIQIVSHFSLHFLTQQLGKLLREILSTHKILEVQVQNKHTIISATFLMPKANHKASPDSRGGKQTPSLKGTCC